MQRQPPTESGRKRKASESQPSSGKWYQQRSLTLNLASRKRQQKSKELQERNRGLTVPCVLAPSELPLPLRSIVSLKDYEDKHVAVHRDSQNQLWICRPPWYCLPRIPKELKGRQTKAPSGLLIRACLDYARVLEHAVIVSQNGPVFATSLMTPVHNTNQYSSFESVAALETYVNGTDHHMFEVLPEALSRYHYLDMEWVNDAETSWTPEQRWESFLRFQNICLAECGVDVFLGLGGLTLTDFCVSFASGTGDHGSWKNQEKYSAHAVTHKLGFRTQAEQHRFMQYMQTRVKQPLNEEERLAFAPLIRPDQRTIWDAVVYSKNQNFRMLFQTKRGSTRILLPERTGDRLAQHLVGVYGTELSQQPQVWLTMPIQQSPPDASISRSTSISRTASKPACLKGSSVSSWLETAVGQLCVPQTRGEDLEYHRHVCRELRPGTAPADSLLPRTLAPHESAEYYLAFLPNGAPLQQGWDVYMTVLFVMKHEANSCATTEALAIIEQCYRWAAQSSRYDRDQTTHDWRSIRPREREYGVATLQRLAQGVLDAFWVLYDQRADSSGIVGREQAKLLLGQPSYLRMPGLVSHRNKVVEQYHERYVRPFSGVSAQTGNVIDVIEAPMGTGKTTQIMELIRKFGYRKVVYVVPRRTLADSIEGDFNSKGLGFVNYQKVSSSELRNSNRKIVQLESLGKLVDKGGYGDSDDYDDYYDYYDWVHSVSEIDAPDLLVLDESESLMKQFSSPTMRGHRLKAVRVLESLLRRTRHIIVADAYLSERSFYPLLELCADTHRLRVSINTYPCLQRRAVEVETLELWFQHILYEIKQNGKAFVVCATKKAAKQLHKLLESESIGNIVYHAETDNQADFLDVKRVWADDSVRCVIATPSLTVGVNFAELNVFSKVFLQTSPHSACVRDLIQAHMRVRQVRDQLLVYYCGQNAKLGGKCPKMLLELDQFAEEVVGEAVRLGVPLPDKAPAWLAQVHLLNRQEEQRSQAQHRDEVERYLRRTGYTLVDPASTEADSLLPTLKPPSRPLAGPEDDKFIRYEQLELLEFGESQALKAKGKSGQKLTAREQCQLDKYKYRRHYLQAAVSEEDAAKVYNAYFCKKLHKERFFNVLAEQRGYTAQDQYAREREQQQYGMYMEPPSWQCVEQIAELKTMLSVTLSASWETTQHCDEPIVLSDQVVSALLQREQHWREVFGLRDRAEKGPQKQTSDLRRAVALVNQVLLQWSGVVLVLSKQKPPKSPKRQTVTPTQTAPAGDRVYRVTLQEKLKLVPCWHLIKQSPHQDIEAAVPADPMTGLVD